MNGIIFYIFIALLGLVNPLFTALGITGLLGSIHSSLQSIMSSATISWFQNNLAIVYYFFPKDILWTLLGVTFVLLALRLGLAIWHAIKW